MNSPLVSIIVLVYNHEEYIAQCLESILRQDYENFEVIVFEDQSDDGSWRKIQEINARDKRVKAYRNEKNLGASKNFEAALAKCQGKYVAMCEGDDYWTSVHKLKWQVEQAEGDSKVSIVYADYGKVDDIGNVLREKVLDSQPASFKLENLMMDHGPSTNSILFRKSVFPTSLPKEFHEVINPDVFVIGFALNQGESRFINLPLSMHREHQGGIWTSIDRFERGLHKYSSLYKFYRCIGHKELELKALDLFERQVILAREKESPFFQKFFRELPPARRWKLKVKWAYARANS
jgi:glycosyltransferase involved in cell wall biosynthesis